MMAKKIVTQSLTFWPKVTENQTNHVVAPWINRPVTVTQYHLLRNNGCRK